MYCKKRVTYAFENPLFDGFAVFFNKFPFPIGIGSGVKHDELVKIASDQSHALAVANFESLQTLTSELTFVTCNSAYLFVNDILS